ncbi:MAG: cyclic nucleotide-binding domain-containing protein [Ktedonobacteraceae bacterium]|nr:cyclic nucleotide-binding domain-containing protein [Ktedonobacteraceae bacterium]
MTNEEFLARVDLFSTLSKKEIQTLVRSCQERRYAAGEILFSQGDPGVGLYVIQSGRVSVTQAPNPDKAEEKIAELGEGDVLGEMALLDELPRSATATAVEDVVALLLPVWEFRATLRNNPDIALSLLAVLSRRLRKAERRVHEV